MAYAIIVAGGEGLRMYSPEPKQYLKIKGVPVLVHTLRVFWATGLFKAMVLVLPEKDLYTRVGDLMAYGKMGPIIFVSGGYCRQESVYNALKKLEPFVDPNETVCVHDAVRPIMSGQQIYQCLKAAEFYGASVMGLPITETVKRCDEMGYIVDTVPREHLWLAKTPQCARFELLWYAHNNAINHNIVATDDAALLEALDVPVVMVRGSRTNVKITYPEDLTVAEKLLPS